MWAYGRSWSLLVRYRCSLCRWVRSLLVMIDLSDIAGCLRPGLQKLTMRSVCGGSQVTNGLRALQDGTQRSLWMVLRTMQLARQISR